MVDPLSQIYSELQRLEIHEFVPFCRDFEESVQIREFASAVTQNKSVIDGRPWRSKLHRMSFSVRLGSLTILTSIWWNIFFCIIFKQWII